MKWFEIRIIKDVFSKSNYFVNVMSLCLEKCKLQLICILEMVLSNEYSFLLKNTLS